MREECLICGAPLEYLAADEMMECALCHTKEPSKTRCTEGHYVCSACHTAGMDVIIGMCLKEVSRDPVEIIEKLMGQPFCHMHGPEHHVMVGSALLTAYKNAGGDIDLPQALAEMMSRGKSIPGGPRCCKRDSYLSILAAVDFVKEHLGIEMEKPEIVCNHSAQNNQCIGKRCPFARVNH